MCFYLNVTIHPRLQTRELESLDLNIRLSNSKDHTLITKIPNLDSLSVSLKTNPSDPNPFSPSDLHTSLRKKKTFEDMARLRENV